MTKIAVILALGAATLTEVVGIEGNPKQVSNDLNDKANDLCLLVLKERNNPEFTRIDVLKEIIEKLSVEELLLLAVNFVESKVEETMMAMANKSPIAELLQGLEPEEAK